MSPNEEGTIDPSLKEEGAMGEARKGRRDKFSPKTHPSLYRRLKLNGSSPQALILQPALLYDTC